MGRWEERAECRGQKGQPGTGRGPGGAEEMNATWVQFVLVVFIVAEDKTSESPGEQ